MNVKINEDNASEKLNKENSVEAFYDNTLRDRSSRIRRQRNFGETNACVSKYRRCFYSYSTKEKPNDRTTI